jgi:hypothetical protein
VPTCPQFRFHGNPAGLQCPRNASGRRRWRYGRRGRARRSVRSEWRALRAGPGQLGQGMQLTSPSARLCADNELFLRTGQPQRVAAASPRAGMCATSARTCDPDPPALKLSDSVSIAQQSSGTGVPLSSAIGGSLEPRAARPTRQVGSSARRDWPPGGNGTVRPAAQPSASSLSRFALRSTRPHRIATNPFGSER